MSKQIIEYFDDVELRGTSNISYRVWAINSVKETSLPLDENSIISIFPIPMEEDKLGFRLIVASNFNSTLTHRVDFETREKADLEAARIGNLIIKADKMENSR